MAEEERVFLGERGHRSLPAHDLGDTILIRDDPNSPARPYRITEVRMKSHVRELYGVPVEQ